MHCDVISNCTYCMVNHKNNGTIAFKWPGVLLYLDIFLPSCEPLCQENSLLFLQILFHTGIGFLLCGLGFAQILTLSLTFAFKKLDRM